MKVLNNTLFDAAIAASSCLANTASAQYKPTGDDGITASPKPRRQLDKRNTQCLIAPLK